MNCSSRKGIAILHSAYKSYVDSQQCVLCKTKKKTFCSLLHAKFFTCLRSQGHFCYHIGNSALRGSRYRSAVHNLFAIADRITLIFMNCSRQCIEDILIFWIASLLLPHTEPRLLQHVCLDVFRLSTLI